MFKILFNPEKAERHPFEMMFIAIFYSSLSIILSWQLFPEQASLFMVFLTVLSVIYVIQGAFKIEEIKNRKNLDERKLLKNHFRVLMLIVFLFIGFVVSFSFWSFIFSNETSEIIFSMQNSAVQSIRENIASSLKDTDVSGNFMSVKGLNPIIFNNLKVLFVSLLFALFFGAGAIFILVWNASIMGYVIGNFTKESFGIIGMPIAFTKYFIHGIPEMFAYITVALAGGILYVAFWRGDFVDPEKNKRIIIDTIVLILISIFFLILAAFLEVYVSPLI